MFRRLREILTGRYESKPLRLITKDEALAFAAENVCETCGEPIIVGVEDFRVVNDTVLGITAEHRQCEIES